MSGLNDVMIFYINILIGYIISKNRIEIGLHLKKIYLTPPRKIYFFVNKNWKIQKRKSRSDDNDMIIVFSSKVGMVS